MNKHDQDELMKTWHSDTSYLNDKIDEVLKCAQDHAYALGLKRGRQEIPDITNDQILQIAEPFGEFQAGDAQGHKRIEFARAVIAALRSTP